MIANEAFGLFLIASIFPLHRRAEIELCSFRHVTHRHAIRIAIIAQEGQNAGSRFLQAFLDLFFAERSASFLET